MLLLPYTMAQVGPLLAYVLLGVAAAASYASLRICCAGMHATGARSYYDVLTKLFSRRFATVLTLMLILACFGMCCGYFVFASQLLLQLLTVAGAPEVIRSRANMLLILAVFPVYPLALLRKLSDFRYLTLMTLLGLTYLTFLVIGGAPHYLPQSGLDANWWRVRDVTSIPKCLSLCFYSYTVHMNVFACYGELHNPTSARIDKVLWRSTIVQTVLYASIALFGFLSFGSNTPDNILRAYDKDSWLANLGRVFVSCQLLLGIPLTVHPGRAYLWPLLKPVLPQRWSGSRRALTEAEMVVNPSAQQLCTGDGGSFVVSDPCQSSENIGDIPLGPHLLISGVFVALSVWVAVKVPSASDLMGVVGGFACVTYVFLLPARVACRLLEDPDRVASSPAAFLTSRWGRPTIACLLLCSGFGYVAATQSLIAIVSKKPN